MVKSFIARRFSKAAATYHAEAMLQRDLAENLWAKTADLNVKPKVICDLGCGTGFAMHLMRRDCPEATVIGLDVSESMLKVAKALPGTNENQQWIAADMDRLPLADHSVDLVFCNMVLQWSLDLSQSVSEIYRVLKPGGYFCWSLLVENSFFELQGANEFVNSDVYKEACEQAGFRLLFCESEKRVLTYPSALTLLQHLKKIGASQPKQRNPHGLRGKHWLEKFSQAYQPYCDEAGHFPLTHQCLSGVHQR